MRTSLEVADIFHAAGPAYRAAHAGHLSLHQIKVMSAIEHCRTAALGGHVEACTDCGHWRIAYNSCRNRHCPKCQGAAARTWLAEREADLLPVGYFHVVFTLPAEVADIAFQNKALVYDLLFRAASETMLTIAADPRHLGVRIGITAVLHTWGSALTHHPHVHMIVPGGGIAPGGQRWISSRAGLPPAGARSGQGVPPPVPHRPDRAAGSRAARLLRIHGPSGRPARLPASPLANSKETLGGLRQGALCWARSRARLSVALHTPCRHLEPAAHRLRRDRRHLPLQGLSPRRRRPAAGHDACSARVHSPFPAPRAAARIPSHPPLRPARRRYPQGQPRTRTRTARCRAAASTTTCRRNRPIPAHHARAVAATWSSSRPSRDGASPARRRPLPRRPGETSRDPARPGLATPRSACASSRDRALQTTSAASAGHNPAPRRTERTARSSDNAPRRRHVRCFPPSVAPRATQAVDRNPHRPHLRPAGSFFGDFRTPIGARNSSRKSGPAALEKWRQLWRSGD